MKFALNYDYPPVADFSGLFGTFDRLLSSAPGALRVPESDRLAVDFFESDTEFYLRAELPGTKREDVGIEVENRVLTVSHGESTRAFQLPEAASSDEVSATLEDGILTIVIGRAEEVKPRTIEIN